MSNIFKIYHHYDIQDEPLYIETNLDFIELADIIVGFQFYIETNTKHGEYHDLEKDMILYILENYFNCKKVLKNDIINLPYYDKDIDDLEEDYWLDMFSEREYRCGKYYKKYIKKIKKYTTEEGIQKICNYYNDDSYFLNNPIDVLAMIDILDKY